MSSSLSKSTFIRGLQCEKSLYLHKFHAELRNPEDAGQQAIFGQGTKVGELAQLLFLGGVDCSFSSYEEINQAIEDTRQAIERGHHIIYEAAFKFDNVLVFADILVNDKDGWKMYEVKSSTSVKDTYVRDAALQSYVISNSGIDLKDVFIVHINNQYVRNGELEIERLFTKVSVKEAILELPDDIQTTINELRSVLDQEEIPEKALGQHCWNPYACDFSEYCWANVPTKSVFEVRGLRTNRKFQLYDGGTELLMDIPDDFHLSDKQRMQVEGERSGTSVIDNDKVKEFVEALNYPLYFLDFETFNPAVPLYDFSRPYEQLPFQYSLHIQVSPGSPLMHHEYLAETDGTDPRIRFVTQLIKDCGTSGDIVVYNQGFERGKITSLAKYFAAYSESLLALNERLVDLMLPFQKGWYYTPEMRGSYSIKYVLPALVPELRYSDLEIGDGGTASLAFATMAAGEYEGDHDKVRADLLAYCKLDTLAMAEILKHLRTKMQ